MIHVLVEVERNTRNAAAQTNSILLSLTPNGIYLWGFFVKAVLDWGNV